jgi:hypothetical protein
MHRNWLVSFAAAITSVSMAVPATGMAASPLALGNDVALRDGGLLVGQVVNPQGVAQANSPVSIRFANHEVVRTTTDANGVFAARGLRGGQYELVTTEGVGSYRLWAADTAPPAARPAVLLVSGDQVVRGQGFMAGGQGMMSSWVGWMKAHPYITAGTVAAAIAVPIAVLDDDDDSGS